MGEIMLNKSFIGSWGQDNADNIPHEIINMFQSDNRELFIYVPPYGGYEPNGHPKIDYILLTGSWNQKTTEVFYVLKGLTRLHSGGKKATSEDREKQIKLIKEKDIRYGGKYLHEIKMSAQEEAITFYMTFQAQSMQKPKKKLFLSWNKEASVHTEQKDVYALPSDYLYFRQYGYLPPEDAVIVSEIIQNNELWEDAQVQPVSKQTGAQAELMTWVKLAHKEYDETVYTNLFYEFFNACPPLFTKFARDVLNVETKEPFIVRKEVTTTDGKGRLDLLAENSHFVIAIENKLQSGLHGIDKHNKLSQLTTYINFIEQDILKGRQGYYFLFEPDYNDIDIASFDSQRGLEWQKCQYSTIYQFISENKQLLQESCLSQYADDFINAISIHAKQLREVVENRFLEAIHGK